MSSSSFAWPSLVPCEPPFWAPGGHSQTILGNFIPSPAYPEPGERIEVKLPDGDRLVCRYFAGKSDVVVYLFHGLSGSAASDYMRRTTAVARSLGHSVYVMNHRGCGEGEGLARGHYHMGSAGDLSAVIQEGRKQHPEKKHIAMGYSLGGNALLLLLSGRRGDCLPDAGIAVNAPVDLYRTSMLLKKGFTRIYDDRFVRDLTAHVKRQKRDGLVAEVPKVPFLTTMYEFDEIYTAKAAGFRDREDYYKQCSSQAGLADIKVPTVILSAKDDPFVDYQDYTKVPLGKSVHLHLETIGGHIGYLAKKPTPLGTIQWLDYALHEYLVAFQSGPVA